MPQKNLKKLLNNIASKAPKRPRTEEDLINAESELGRTIFGPVPAGHTREFFHHKQNVWIWYENGTTIRYEVRTQGVFKKVMDGGYTKITGTELENFRSAVKTYHKLVKAHIYSQ